MDFGTTEDGGRASVFFGLQRGINDKFAMLEDGAVEEYKSVQSLSLSCRGNISFEDEMVEERCDGIGSGDFR